MSCSIRSDQSRRLLRTTNFLTALLVTLVFTSSASATEGDGRIGFDFRLRPPDGPSAIKLAGSAAPVPPVTEPSGPDLGFDLLDPVAKTETVNEHRIVVRRKMLNYHQLTGIGLLVCETTTIVVGQLNYNDRFGGGPSSGRYERLHAVLAFGTAGFFLGTGLLAVLAPNPLNKKHQGLDHILLHKIGMFTAAAGIATEIALGLYTTKREGYLNQKSFAQAHLATGYITLAATYLGVGSIVF